MSTNDILSRLKNLQGNITELIQIISAEDSKNDLATKLGPIPDMAGWPEAVPEHLIIKHNDFYKSRIRAAQIASNVIYNQRNIKILGRPTIETRILDCGCGDGFLADHLSESGAGLVVGYDIKLTHHLKTFAFGNAKYCTSVEQVEAHKPYDIVILHDVIDHLQNQNPTEFLKWITSLLSVDGTIFIRFHPWTSRHGSHLHEYHHDAPLLNKAFIHLALTIDEISDITNNQIMPNLKVLRPLAMYDKMIKDVGLRILLKTSHASDIKQFVGLLDIARIINATWGGRIDANTAIKIMSNDYIDYICRLDDWP